MYVLREFVVEVEEEVFHSVMRVVCRVAPLPDGFVELVPADKIDEFEMIMHGRPSKC